jgi:hypothetical protein
MFTPGMGISSSAPDTVPVTVTCALRKEKLVRIKNRSNRVLLIFLPDFRSKSFFIVLSFS